MDYTKAVTKSLAQLNLRLEREGYSPCSTLNQLELPASINDSNFEETLKTIVASLTTEAQLILLADFVSYFIRHEAMHQSATVSISDHACF